MLVAVALVVALGAGGSVYALMNGSDDGRTDGKASPGPTATAPVDAGQESPKESGTGSDPSSGQPSAPAPTDGVVPTAYLGTWSATITNADGVNTRRLTLQQGEVGDTVMSLAADGPTSTGSYHCVFQARLTARPDGGGPVEVGPSTVVSGDPGYCKPGEATEISLLPDGTLERANPSSGEKLIYTKQ
jgi:hypothetical protein